MEEACFFSVLKYELFLLSKDGLSCFNGERLLVGLMLDINLTYELQLDKFMIG